MQNPSPVTQTDTPRRAFRRRRTAAAVIAQYIQDLSHPQPPLPCSPAA